MAFATWYSFNADELGTDDHELDSVQHAESIVEQYWANIRGSYESGEQALALTSFAFSKDSGEFIELCLHREDETDLAFATPVAKKLLWLIPVTSEIRIELTARSKHEVFEFVRSFFQMETEDYVEYVRSFSNTT